MSICDGRLKGFLFKNISSNSQGIIVVFNANVIDLFNKLCFSNSRLVDRALYREVGQALSLNIGHQEMHLARDALKESKRHRFV